MAILESDCKDYESAGMIAKPSNRDRFWSGAVWSDTVQPVPFSQMFIIAGIFGIDGATLTIDMNGWD